ncbi:MAG: S26 family signal peptidase [Candidatus Dormibacteria bacterium]
MLSPLRCLRTPVGQKTLLGCALIVAATWTALRPRRVEVFGDSMAPALQPGERFLAIRPVWLRPGDVVVLADPRDPRLQMVKRVMWKGAGSGERRAVWVEGDNARASTDSRELGVIRQSLVRARLVWRYWPSGRSGRLASPAHRPHRLRP